MPDRIKKLCIQNFRGATQTLDLTFDEKKSVLLIFGENGTGKSTIIDALECVASGTTTFYDTWKLGKGLRKETYIPTLGKSLNDVKIALEFGDNTYTATLNAKGIKLCNTPDRPQVKVLRRKSLQAFIDADPAQRYKEVSNFLDIPQIEASEASLRKAFKEAKQNFESATKANAQALETLQGLWEAEGNPGLGKEFNSAEAWARKQSKSEINSLEKELTNLKEGVKLIENLVTNAQNIKQGDIDFKQAEKEIQQAREQLATIESNSIQSNAQLVTLLEDAKIYLKVSPDEICPVCEETKIEPNNLIQRLEQRITGMDKLKQANDVVKRAQKNLQTKSVLLQKIKENVLNSGEKAQTHFVENIANEGSIQKQRTDKPEQAIKLAIALNKELTTQHDELQEQLDKIQKQSNTLTTIKQLVATLDEKSSEAKNAERLQKSLGQVVEIVETKRKAYVDTILIEIAQSVDTLYEKIHPEENIGHLKLKLDAKQQGSLIYGATFGGQDDIHPQPYYSESHLDTLGLCIFLALSKRGKTDKTIVVLDDVLGSVDQQHLKKTLDMLLQEAGNFAQIVMATHYRPLRDQFRYARSPSTPVQLLELKPWNIEQGIRSGKTPIYVQELKQQLDEDTFRRDVIASQAGQLFENLLEFISRTYRCKVPHTIEPRFTFGELSSAPNKELKKKLKIIKKISDTEIVETELKTIYDKLDEAIGVRNLVGCHFNQWAGELADQDIREMAELALEFADTLICSNCKSLATSNKSGSYWECSCKKTQMHPLQQPKK